MTTRNPERQAVGSWAWHL